MRVKLWEEWNNILLLEKASPYIFRTKLERVINHTIIYANREGNDQLLRDCQLITHKLKYISDQSNQTSEGCLNSFIILKEDFINIRTKLNIQYA